MPSRPVVINPNIVKTACYRIMTLGRYSIHSIWATFSANEIRQKAIYKLSIRNAN